MMIGEKQRGLLFVMVGPGGTGKNTLMNEVMEQLSLKQLATATTRPMRPTEEQGREHHFVSPEEFRRMIANNELLEYQEVTTDKFYGIPRSAVKTPLDEGTNLIADIDVLGAKIVRETFPEDVVLIFVTVPGTSLEDQLATLRERMLQRLGHEPTAADIEHIDERLERARTLELPFAKECNYILVNDHLETTAQQLNKIIRQKIQERSA
ncbi:MAG: hypothetical protein KC496_17390 [Anaerolineae bacterium]|nr:hypothetical protein [Anaerolineae bacterium]